MKQIKVSRWLPASSARLWHSWSDASWSCCWRGWWSAGNWFYCVRPATQGLPNLRAGWRKDWCLSQRGSTRWSLRVHRWLACSWLVSVPSLFSLDADKPTLRKSNCHLAHSQWDLKYPGFPSSRIRRWVHSQCYVQVRQLLGSAFYLNWSFFL